MPDILKLTDTRISIQKRYDSFLLWCNENPTTISEVIAEKLGVGSSVVDVYLLLSDLEDEFDIIDKKMIDIDFLFLIVRCEKILRMKIYDKSETIFKSDQPVNALRTFIDVETVPDFNSLIQKISPKAWSKIAKYLKDRSIKGGSVTLRFRNMLVLASKHKKGGREISEKMVDWIVRAITYDKEKGLNIFLHDGLKKECPEDFKIFENILSEIDVITLIDK